MTFSIDKLCKILSLKGFICKNFYKLNGRCTFIEVVSLNNGNVFILYIPKKYFFDIERYQHYKLKYINLDENDKDEILKEYVGNPDFEKLEQDYESIDLESEYSKKSAGGIENQLEYKYKKTINLKDIDQVDNIDIKCIIRQLRRLRYCVQNIRYKLCIKYKKYICFIRNEERIDCFYIRKYLHEKSDENNREIMITVNLDLLYENLEILDDDIIQIKKGLNQILNKNHLSHAKSFENMMEKKSDVISMTQNLYNKKENIDKYIISFHKLLLETNVKYTNLYNQLNKLREIKNSKKGDVQHDITYSHQIKYVTEQLENTENVKDNILSQISNLNQQHQHLSLMTDKILFDNAVMLDKILKNLNFLKNYI